MQVLIINTSDQIGGAAIAARRLLHALQQEGMASKMLVCNKKTKEDSIYQVSKLWQKKITFLWERFSIWKHNHFSKAHLFEIDIANAGIDITQTKVFQEADIIHLHWINQGFLSIKQLDRILSSGKPVVWTMHDLWAATGICHCTFDCRKFEETCHHCPLLEKPSTKDLAYRTFIKKLKLFQKHQLTFVGCSQWTASEAKKSTLLKGQEIISIPNTLDTSVFSPSESEKARTTFHLPQDKKLLLFASMNVTSPYKGVSYLIQACQHLVQEHPETLERYEIVVLGAASDRIAHQFPYPVHCIPYQTEEQKIAQLYNASSVYITPSLQDNLPNTVMEAMACGTPCVGFQTGGIPEMIDHKINGYIAAQRDAKGLAEGIYWTLQQPPNALRLAARNKVETCYTPKKVAQEFKQLYTSLLRK